MWKSFLVSPRREYALTALLVMAFAADYAFGISGPLFVLAIIAVLPTAWDALKALKRGRIGIDIFNMFAVAVSYATGETRSAGFIALMLTSARILDWRTESRTRDAVEELMRLVPVTATCERDGGRLEPCTVAQIAVDDVVVVRPGERVPVDGLILSGKANVNEAPVTGESVPVEKLPGDHAVCATLVEDGMLRIRATRVGADSTLERMATLMRESAKNKSRAERMADRFAGAFLPLVLLLGALTYALTRDLRMTAALFLVACADDMAVAIPLAMTASLGKAAERGVVVKGGEWLDVLGRMRTLVLDKTGTLTYGKLSVRDVRLEPGVETMRFWRVVAMAERYSEHPVGRAAFHAAVKQAGEPGVAESFEVFKGSGVRVRADGEDIVVGTEALFAELGLKAPAPYSAATGSVAYVAVGGRLLGALDVADVPRPEAPESLARLRKLGVRRIIMLTGDREQVARGVSAALGITEYRAGVTPEGKLAVIEELLKDGPVGMVGDGINDAPSLARADVGIAMGGGGTAVSVEAADVVIMNDDISRLPEMVELGRRTFSVIRGDTVIWVFSNLIGFALVLTGVAGPAFAAFYNFFTDFFPLLNSSRLFQSVKRGL
ncbi:MAG: hypothetical protein RLZZ324_419 [Candidatus Parcubacteria bacterium]|jgi:heavy metal translocating P-type ATPase